MARIREKQIRSLMRHAQAELRELPSNGVLSAADGAEQQVFLLAEGLAYIYTQNEYDEPELSGIIEKGQLIPGTYLTSSPAGTFRYIHCKRSCRFVRLTGRVLKQPIPGSPAGSPALLEAADKSCIEALSRHCHLLQQRTTERKLLAYFKGLSPSGSRQIRRVPLPYSDLCAYLQVERSAMMKVLAQMVSEGVLSRDGRDIRLAD